MVFAASPRVDKVADKRVFSDRPLTIAFAVTEASANTVAGDFFSASELADACVKEFGWRTRFLSRSKDWYDLSGVDVLVVLLDAYRLSNVENAKPELVKIAWLRNWFERWASGSDFDGYDLYLMFLSKVRSMASRCPPKAGMGLPAGDEPGTIYARRVGQFAEVGLLLYG